MQSNSGRDEWVADNALSLCPSHSGFSLLTRLSIDNAPFERRKVNAGASLIQAGQTFEALLLVKSGYLKTVFTDEGGNEQVVSFPSMGDLLGTDGIATARYMNDAIALSGVEVISIPFTNLEALQESDPEIVDRLFRIISHQLVQEQLALTAIGALCADARVARFLLKVCFQLQGQGYPGQSLHLWMTRQDIGNYLGMKIETVSRMLTLLGSMDLIKVDQRDVEILDLNGLKEIAYDGSSRQGPLLVRQRRSRSAGCRSGSRRLGTNFDQDPTFSVRSPKRVPERVRSTP